MINDDKSYAQAVGSFFVNLYNTAVNNIKGNSGSQSPQQPKQPSNSSSQSSNKPQEITIDEKDRIDRSILHPPAKPSHPAGQKSLTKEGI